MPSLKSVGQFYHILINVIELSVTLWMDRPTGRIAPFLMNTVIGVLSFSQYHQNYQNRQIITKAQAEH